MAIRLRFVDGEWIALCAAETTEQPGDIYLDDAQDHAIRKKIEKDWASEGIVKTGDDLKAEIKQWVHNPDHLVSKEEHLPITIKKSRSLHCAVYHHRHGIDVIPFMMEDPTEPDPGFINDSAEGYDEFLDIIGIDDFEPEEGEYIDFLSMRPIRQWAEVPSRAPYLIWNALDGVTADPLAYEKYGEASKAREEYLSVFRQIGYYSGSNMQRVRPEDLEMHVIIIPQSELGDWMKRHAEGG